MVGERKNTNKSGILALTVYSVNAVARIEIGVGRDAATDKGHIDRVGFDSFDIVTDLKLFFVCVPEELGRHCWLVAKDQLRVFATEDGPTVVIARWNVRYDVYLIN